MCIPGKCTTSTHCLCRMRALVFFRSIKWRYKIPCAESGPEKIQLIVSLYMTQKKLLRWNYFPDWNSRLFENEYENLTYDGKYLVTRGKYKCNILRTSHIRFTYIFPTFFEQRECSQIKKKLAKCSLKVYISINAGRLFYIFIRKKNTSQRKPCNFSS